jgi:hypothetical protein
MMANQPKPKAEPKESKVFRSKREFERAMFPRLHEDRESDHESADHVGERLAEALREGLNRRR